MSFVASSFIFFLIIFFILFYICPKRLRWIVVLIGSYIFYSFEDIFFLIPLFLSTVVDFYSSIQIEKNRSSPKKYLFLVLSLSTNIGMLAYFKYADFAMSIFDLSQSMSYSSNPSGLYAIPIGISFYTFQTISYTIDVFRGSRKAERDFGIFAVFVSFFPQLVAGPIEKSSSLIPQIKSLPNVKFNQILYSQAFSLIIWGFFKKLLIADRLGVIVDKIYSTPADFSSITLIISGCLFMIQIYCDFSGYTLIARGVAQLFGIELSKNWNYPLFQTSFRDFWKNWHITLSNWFKDYIYIPLGGRKNSFFVWSSVVLLVFLLSGLWHGANYTFIVWGLLNAIALLIEKLLSKYIQLVKINFISCIFVFFFCGVFFISFRSNSIHEFVEILRMSVSSGSNLIQDYVKFDMWIVSHLVNAVLLFVFFLYEWTCFKNKTEINHSLISRPEIQAALFLVIVVLAEFQNKPFIYFQF